MDPLTALIIAMWVASRFTKNVYQDSVFKARGEDPPSFRREMARWEAKQARSANRTSDGPGRRFFANAWRDAVESADERRARAAQKAAERRRSKWTEVDRAKAEDEAHAINERLIDEPPAKETQEPKRVDDAPPASPDHAERMVQCAACGNDVRATDTSWITVDGATLAVCPPCRLKRAEPPKQEFPEPPECPPTAYDGTLEPAPPAPAGQGAEVIQFADWQNKASAGPAPKESNMSAEITGLQSAIAFAQGSATAADQSIVQTEMAIANLQAGGTSGDAITQLQQAMENLGAVAATFRAAEATLSSQLAVTEAYAANQGAGSREFVTSE